MPSALRQLVSIPVSTFVQTLKYQWLVRAMKEAGLTWTPQPGCYVWDPLGRIGAPSPFPESIYFILDLKNFLRRLGKLATITTELVWLPTVDQALWLCSEYGVHPDSLEVFDYGRSWLSPDESLLVLYHALLRIHAFPSTMRMLRSLYTF